MGTKFILGQEDGTIAGGNARGDNAVDLQMSRGSANEVASGVLSTIAGGTDNRASGNYSTIVGGAGCTASGQYSVSGGLGANVSNYAGVCFGNANTNGSYGGVVSGGQNNIGGSSDYVVIGGGRVNNTTGSSYSTISGGATNTASSNFSTVSGGQSNTASSNTHATVVGGSGNTGSGNFSVVGGGSSQATNTSTVALGGNCTASGIGTVAIGRSCSATQESAVSIGYQNTASGKYSNALGLGAISYLQGMQTYSSIGGFVGNGEAQSSILVPIRLATLTTGGTTTLSLDGTGVTNLIIPNGNDRMWNVQVRWVAVVTAITGTATGVTVGDTKTSTDLLAVAIRGGVTTVSAHTSAGTHVIETTAGSLTTVNITYSAGASQEMAITFTGPTFVGGGSVTMRVVAAISLTEVSY